MGSANPIKVRAVGWAIQGAFPGAVVESVATPSRVAPQPRSEGKTLQGALNRARQALKQSGADLGVGLESGLTRKRVGPLSIHWCALLHRQGALGVASSGHFLLPEWMARRLEEGRELGEVMEELGDIPEAGRQMGAVGRLSGGLVDREALIAHAVRLALVRLLSAELFEGSQ